jgi:hypothetical protein
MIEQTTTNPLQQYFRRPAIYLKLPSQGNGYPEGALNLPENGEVPIYPMTTIDEITSRTPDALFNGTAIVELVRSCVPNIIDPWCIPVIDVDPLLIAIRAASSGDKMEIETTCPSCEEEAKYDVNLTGVLTSFKLSDYSKPLVIDELTIKFRPLVYREINESNVLQFEVQRMMGSLQNIEDDTERSSQSTDLIKKLNEMTIKLLVATIEYIKTPKATVFEKEFIEDYLRNCDKNTFNKIKNTNIELRSNSEAKPLTLKCMHCQHEYKQSFIINVSNFFD